MEKLAQETKNIRLGVSSFDGPFFPPLLPMMSDVLS